MNNGGFVDPFPGGNHLYYNEWYYPPGYPQYDVYQGLHAEEQKFRRMLDIIIRMRNIMGRTNLDLFDRLRMYHDPNIAQRIHDLVVVERAELERLAHQVSNIAG